MQTVTKLRLMIIVGLSALILVLGGVKAAQLFTMARAAAAMTPPPAAVTATTAQEALWEPTRPAIGTLVAERGVTLGAEVPGLVREIAFESGASVERGDVLVELDRRAEEAQLAAARADAALAKLTLERAEKLRMAYANAPADLDAARARAKQAEAAVAGLRATIDKKTIRAPFDGRIAIRQVELGQVLSPGDPVASLQSVSPIYADFWLPQQALAEVERGQLAALRTDAFAKHVWHGAITVINPEVDPSTRNVRVRATFPNPDGRLRPGMFANVELSAGEPRRVLAIPASAVLFAPYGDSVFTVEEERQDGRVRAVARQKFVRVGERRGDFVAVVSGLSPGEKVVSSGAFKLQNGAPIHESAALAPKPQLMPRPTEE